MSEIRNSGESTVSRKKWRGLLPIGAYLLMGAVFLLPLVPRVHTHILADDGFGRRGVSDAYNFLWSYWWVQKAVSEGLNVFHCDWLFPPNGVNLFFHTGIVLPAILTHPLGRLLGTLAGFNCMIWLMLSFAGYAYFLLLRRTFGIGLVPAFVTGCVFGFSPYAIFKAHNGLNCIGFCFWGSALGLLVSAYVGRRFSLSRGVLLAAFVWATFWTSFQEFFMLAAMCAITVIVFEVRHARDFLETLRARAAFAAPTLVGAVSLTSIVWAPSAGPIQRPRVDGFSLLDLFSPPVFSALSGFWRSAENDYWGICVPISVLALAFVGYAKARRIENPVTAMSLPLSILILCVAATEIAMAPSLLPGISRWTALSTIWWLAQLGLLAAVLVGLLFALGWCCRRGGLATEGGAVEGTDALRVVAVLVLVSLAVTLDVLHLPSAVIRSLPFGGGFRVFSRFFPSALFFLLIPTAVGLEWLWVRRGTATGTTMLCVLGVLSCLELVPIGQHPSLAPQFRLPATVSQQLDRDALVWIADDDPGQTDLVMYQIALDMPFARAPRMSRGAIHDLARVGVQYPVVYGGKKAFSAEDFMGEAKRLNIRYVLFRDDRQYRAFPVQMKVLAAEGGTIFTELPRGERR